MTPLPPTNDNKQCNIYLTKKMKERVNVYSDSNKRFRDLKIEFHSINRCLIGLITLNGFTGDKMLVDSLILVYPIKRRADPPLFSFLILLKHN